MLRAELLERIAMSLIININTALPPDPQYVIELAEGLAEIARALNHQTLHGALESPEDADVVVSALATMAHRLPQLLDQVGHWLDAEAQAGHLEVTSGKFAGRPGAVANAVRILLDAAAARFREAETALEAAHQITGAMAPAGEGS
jgi:hypothetical protein